MRSDDVYWLKRPHVTSRQKPRFLPRADCGVVADSAETAPHVTSRQKPRFLPRADCVLSPIPLKRPPTIPTRQKPRFLPRADCGDVADSAETAAGRFSQ